jgi:sterol desaturase/sphingolipid hydroxylase (fatty acid hydroxylase superfamily)
MQATVTRPALAPAGARTAIWAGVLSVAGLTAWLATVGLTDLLSARDLWGVIDASRARLAGPALVVVVVLLLVAEQRWPAVRRPLLTRAQLVDASYFVLFAVAVVPLLTLVETGFSIEIERHVSFLVLGRLSLVPRIVVVAVTLVAIDGMNWCGHVANHRLAALWRLHALHHSQEDMSVLTTFRTHPLAHATYVPALLPALMLGASGAVPAGAIIVYGCLVTLPHANLNWRLGPLGRVIVSPAYHRLHHARDLGERGTVNFGFVLVVWDQLARRAEFPMGGPPVLTGIAGRPVPIEQAGRLDDAGPLDAGPLDAGPLDAGPAGRGEPVQDVARVVVAQLAQPFRRCSTVDGLLTTDGRR